MTSTFVRSLLVVGAAVGALSMAACSKPAAPAADNVAADASAANNSASTAMEAANTSSTAAMDASNSASNAATTPGQ